MPPIQLIHWNPAAARERAGWLRSLGYEVNDDAGDIPALLRALRQNPPLAVVIDLSRSPSQGRDFALAIRHYQATRRTPIVMAGGDPEKLAKIRAQVPDAVYTGWESMEAALAGAIANPPENPIAVSGLLDGYAGQPLPKKLGFRPGSQAALVDAPPGFRETLGELPENARLFEGVQPGPGAPTRYELVIWFILSRMDLARCIAEMAPRQDFGSMWIAWPKKGSGLGEGLAQQEVREAGLAAGLVDYKVCSIDQTWTGLLFTRRKYKKDMGRG
jgi:CheY-like chemotaxis protein